VSAKIRYVCPDCGKVQEFRTLPMYPPLCCGWVMKRIDAAPL
jgi:hypothetical protein